MKSSAVVAAELGVSKRWLTATARRVGAGMFVGGRTGYRFTDADIAKIQSFRPAPKAQGRRRSA